MLHNSRVEWNANSKHCILLVPFITYEENEVLLIRPLVPYSQQFIFFVTYVWVQKARALDYTRPEWFASYKQSSLLSPFVSKEEIEVLCLRSQVLILAFEILAQATDIVY
jgi:hypothetical protein